MSRIFTLVLLTPGCITAMDRSYTFSEDIHTIEITVEAGEVNLVRAPDNEAHLDVSLGGLGRIGEPVVRDGILLIDYACGGVGICGGDVTLSVPDDVLVIAHLSMGDLSLEGLNGPVEASVDSGSISAAGLRGSWISLATAAGDVSAELLDRPEELYTIVGAGAIDLEVPAGAYDLHLDMSVGAISLDGVTDDPGAGALIEARVGTGDISISGR
jgi:hypothetical protein